MVINTEIRKFKKKIVKIGDSLGVIIPDALIYDLGIKPGTEYDFHITIKTEKKEVKQNERNPNNNDIRTENRPYAAT